MTYDWNPITMALADPEIRSGDRTILAVNNTVHGGFYQVVFWDQEAADLAGAPGSLGSGYGWTTMDQEVRYHTEFFTHYMHLPGMPIDKSERKF